MLRIWQRLVLDDFVIDLLIVGASFGVELRTIWNLIPYVVSYLPAFAPTLYSRIFTSSILPSFSILLLTVRALTLLQWRIWECFEVEEFLHPPIFQNLQLLSLLRRTASKSSWLYLSTFCREQVLCQKCSFHRNPRFSRSRISAEKPAERPDFAREASWVSSTYSVLALHHYACLHPTRDKKSGF